MQIDANKYSITLAIAQANNPTTVPEIVLENNKNIELAIVLTSNKQ